MVVGRFCLLFLSLGLVGASGADYHVSPQGNDANLGSATQPFRTITRAYSLAAAGTTIIVLPGVYTDYQTGWGLHLNKNGTASNPITLRSQVRGQAIIDGQNAADRNQGIYLDGSYNRIDGFQIRGGPQGGIAVGGNDNQILNNEIHHNGNPASTSTYGQDGIYSGENTRNTVYRGNYIHDNGRAGSNLDHALYLCGDNELVLNNVLVRNAAYGLHVAGYTTVSNMKVYNNVMAHNGKSGIVLWMAVSGVDIKNNILYQNGRFGFDSWDAHGSGVVLDHNLVFGNASGDYNFINGASDYTYTLGTTIASAPLFVNASSSGFDAHLSAGSPAINAALNLSSTFSTDLDGATRAASGPWDLGAYEYGLTNTTPPTVSLTAPANGASYPAPATINLAASVMANGNTISKVQFFHGSTLLGEDTTSPYDFSWSSVSAGSYSLSARAVYNTSGTVASPAVSVNVSVAPPSELTLGVGSVTITAPFVVTNGTISQPAYTGVTDGGRAAYTFTISTAGDYVVSALVNAPDESANSFFVNIDAEPTDPTMIWDIPITSGLAERTVTWRGSGTPENNEFAPKVFNLSAGTHTLIVRGQEANCQLGTISLAPYGNSWPVISITVTGAGVSIAWVSVSGKTYRVACKSHLTDTNWTDLSGNITATSASTSWADQAGTRFDARYYTVYVVN